MTSSPLLLLNVAHYERASLGNGPGKRFVLWVQGCTLGCSGCLNPHTHPTTARLVMPPLEVIALVHSEPGLEGVTFSGGEPFQQARALTEVCQQLRTSTSLSMMAYTGYTYEYLRTSGTVWQQRLLAALDILVDGPFEAALRAPLMWRGSRNQRVLFLSERYTPEAVGLRDGVQQMELITTSDGRLVRTGFPVAWSALRHALQGHGIEVTP